MMKMMIISQSSSSSSSSKLLSDSRQLGNKKDEIRIGRRSLLCIPSYLSLHFSFLHFWFGDDEEKNVEKFLERELANEKKLLIGLSSWITFYPLFDMYLQYPY